MKKIINIIIFTVAGLACVLALVFVGVYKDDKTLYDEVSLVKEKTPAVVDEFFSVTTENLSDYIDKNQEVANAIATELKEQQLRKDILYTYITQLSDLTAETFPNFKDNFPPYAASLFAKAENPQIYIDGFNKIDNYNGLASYINSLQNEYHLIKQDFIKEKEQLKALNTFIGRASFISETVSRTKQTNQIEELQGAIHSSTKAASILNMSIVFFYITLFAAIILTIFFALYQIFANIKSSYQVFIGIGIMVILVLVAYLVSSSDLTVSAVKIGLTLSQMKMIGAGVITCYIIFFGAILSIIASGIINLFKKV